MIAFIRKGTHASTKWAALFIALTVTATSLLQVAGIKPAFASYSNTYPWNSAPCFNSGAVHGQTSGTGYWCTSYNWGENPCPSGDGFCTPANLINGYYQYDKWGEGFRNCVSYTAWTLNQVFGINTTSWGNGADWNTSALAAGYTDDTSPQIGDIAQWNSPAPWGHAAYVYNVVNGVAYYAEYNHPQDGTYQDSLTSSTQGTPDKWIHIGGTVSTPSTRPGALARSSTDMDTFYQNGTNLVNRYWNSTTGWASTSWSVNASSAPSAVARDSSDMDVFFRDGNNNLVDQHWNSTSGWATTALTSNGSARGNPQVISRDSADMDVYFRDNSNNLVDVHWNSSSGWGTTSWADNIKGDPSPTDRSSGNMDVFFRNTSNNLIDRLWTSTSGWSFATLVSNGTIGGVPGAITPDSGHMDAFYKDGSTGNLYDRWWDSVNGWNTSSWSGTPSANAPSAISRDSNDIDVFYRNGSNNLIDQHWNVTNGWGTSTIDSTGTLATDPSAIDRDSYQSVFYVVK